MWNYFISAYTAYAENKTRGSKLKRNVVKNKKQNKKKCQEHKFNGDEIKLAMVNYVCDCILDPQGTLKSNNCSSINHSATLTR